jgi:hypothetical protein
MVRIVHRRESTREYRRPSVTIVEEALEGGPEFVYSRNHTGSYVKFGPTPPKPHVNTTTPFDAALLASVGLLSMNVICMIRSLGVFARKHYHCHREVHGVRFTERTGKLPALLFLYGVNVILRGSIPFRRRRRS